ncbi:hypothetical protein D3C80_452500 [compost metagenome]
MRHRNDDALGAGYEIHCAAHARHDLAGHHPVGKVSFFVDLKPPQYSDIEMAAANQCERHGAVEGTGSRQRACRCPSGIREIASGKTRIRQGAHADNAVFRLERNVEPGRQVGCDHGGQADPEIDERAGLEFLSNPPRDDLFLVHSEAPFAISKSTRTCGVTTASGSMQPTGTISSGSAITISAAMAISGLKLRDVSE